MSPLPRARTGVGRIHRGPLLMILASLVFTVMVGLVKVARQELSGLEVVLWRGVLSLPLLLALATVFFGIGAHLLLRRLGATDSALTIVFWFHVGVSVLAVPGVLLSQGSLRLPPAGMWVVLVGIALTASVAQLLVTRAIALERAPIVAAASYAGPVWALLGDLVVFALIPPVTAVVGRSRSAAPMLVRSTG